VIESLGTIGALMLAFCAMPQAIMSWKQRHSDGMSAWTLGMWSLGEVLTTIYICLTSMDVILLINYVANLCYLAVIIRYKLYPRRNNET